MPPTSRPPRKPDEETETHRIYRRVAFASRDYLPWVVGSLRIVQMDLSRMPTSGVPVLLGHNGNDVTGRVLNVWQDRDVWRSDYELPKIAANRDTFDRMDTGLLEGISVGAIIQWETLTVDNEDEVVSLDDLLISTSALLIEQSLTPIPADVRAGIGRMLARGGPLPDLFIGGADNGIFTPESAELRERLTNLMRTHNQAAEVRQKERFMTTQTPIPPDVLERAVNEALVRNEALKALTDLPGQIAKLNESAEAESRANMEYRAKLDRLQFQPSGPVLQMANWNPADDALNIGRILQLTADREMGFPQLDRSTSTLEESFLERQELAAPDRSTVARVPFEAVMERSRQRLIQRTALSDAAGARPSMVTILGDAGLLFNDLRADPGRYEYADGIARIAKSPFLHRARDSGRGRRGRRHPHHDLHDGQYRFAADQHCQCFRSFQQLAGRRRRHF